MPGTRFIVALFRDYSSELLLVWISGGRRTGQLGMERQYQPDAITGSRPLGRSRLSSDV
jgi:hypothetical protein